MEGAFLPSGHIVKAMPTTKPKEYPALERPPIHEVVCCIVFESISALDPLVFGIYWDQRKNSFPNRTLLPAIPNEFGFDIGVFPMRAMLSSEDHQFIVQLQHDRFLMNWRAVGATYPRFSEHHGPRGLLVRTLEEYTVFSDFVRSRTNKDINSQRIELTKVDLLRQGEHWRDLDDLTKVVPVTNAFSKVQRSNEREVNLRFVERGIDGITIVHVTSIMAEATTAAIRIESRRSVSVSSRSEISHAFQQANEVLNHAFFELIPSAHERFEKKEKT